jgi:hypothetical protein
MVGGNERVGVESRFGGILLLAGGLSGFEIDDPLTVIVRHRCQMLKLIVRKRSKEFVCNALHSNGRHGYGGDSPEGRQAIRATLPSREASDAEKDRQGEALTSECA